MGHPKLLILIASVFFSATASAKTVVTFEDLPDFIASQSRPVQAAQERVAAEKSRTGHLTRSFLPRVQAYGGGEAFRTGDFERMAQPVGGVEGKINLFRGGRDHLEEKIRKNRMALSESAFHQRSRGELLRARTLFAEILFYRSRVASLKDAIAMTQHSSGLVGKRIEAGLATESDRLEFAMARRSFEQELAFAKEEYEHAVDELRIVLGRPRETLDVRGTLNHFHDPDLQRSEVNTDSHPEVQELKSLQNISKLRQKQSNRWWSPSVDAYGGYALYPFRERERFARGERDEAVVGGRVTFQIFDGLDGKSEAGFEKHEALAFGQEAMQRQEEVEGSFRKLKHELKIRHDMAHAMERNLSEGRLYFSLSSEEYDRGVRNSRDMFSSLQRYLDQKLNHARALKDYFVVRSELLGVLGQ